MNFKLKEGIAILERTPQLLKDWLSGLPHNFVNNNEGPDTWSPYDVVGHLIQGEKDDWITRSQIILSGSKTPFHPFDRFAQFEHSKGKPLDELLDEFIELRKKSLDDLHALNIQESDLAKTGIHPGLGEVTLRQLLSTWVAHDLGHIVQISRTMARQYTNEVGPWTKYLSVFDR
jgi:hypothetical protein